MLRRDRTIFVASGIHPRGESQTPWRHAEAQGMGLHGIEYGVSDDPAGLRQAPTEVLAGAV